MSRVETPPAVRQPEAGAERPARAVWSLGLLRNEVVTVFRRRRTLALLAVLAAVPVLIGVAVRLETRGDRGGGGGPAFIADVTNNGLFLVFTALAVTLPVFLPMAVGVVAGDAVAGEAAAGTLRYLLVAPAGRSRLLLVKYASVLAFCLVATVVVAVSALLTGAALFPLGDVALINSVKAVKNLPATTSREEIALMANNWRPYRTVAAFLLWHAYIIRRGMKVAPYE